MGCPTVGSPKTDRRSGPSRPFSRTSLRGLPGQGAGWFYNSTTVRQANAAAANKIEVIVGVVEDAMHVVHGNEVYSSNGSNYGSIGIGVNVTNAFYAGTKRIVYFAGVEIGVSTVLDLMPSLGYSYYAAVENSGAGTTTFYANSGSSYLLGGIIRG